MDHVFNRVLLRGGLRSSYRLQGACVNRVNPTYLQVGGVSPVDDKRQPPPPPNRLVGKEAYHQLPFKNHSLQQQSSHTTMASFAPSKILIFGGTGQIGAYITEALLSATPPFHRITLFTSEETARSKDALLSGWKARGLEVVTGDVTDKAKVQAAYADGVDTVVSAVGRDVLLHQKELIRWAEESGSVRWFFPSEYGTDIEYGPKSAGERPHQAKLEVRRFIRQEVKKVRATYLVTGPYSDMYFNLVPSLDEAGGFDVKGKRAVLVEDGEGKVGFTTMRE